MNARRLLSTISVLGLLATGCARSDTPSTESGSDPVPAEATTYDDDPDGAVVRIGWADRLPSLVIGGDGWAYFPSGVDAEPVGLVDAGALARIAPAPPVATPVSRRQSTAEGIDIVLERAADLDLLEVPDEYDAPQVTPERHVVTNGGAAYLADVADSRVWPADVDIVEGCVAFPVDRFPGGAAGIRVADTLDGATLIGVVPDLPGDSCARRRGLT